MSLSYIITYIYSAILTLCNVSVTRYGVMAGGDLVLQGVFDVHAGNALRQADPGGAHPLVSECGGVPTGGGVQALEALYYALDLVNDDPDVLPGVPLGAATFDSCRSPQRAVRHTENLLSGKVQVGLDLFVCHPSSNALSFRCMLLHSSNCHAMCSMLYSFVYWIHKREATSTIGNQKHHND